MKGGIDRIADLVREIISRPSFKTAVEKLLIEILTVDTSPAKSVEKVRASEELVFLKLSDFLNRLGNLKGRVERHPVRGEIGEHEFYTKIFPSGGGEEMPAAAVYRNRFNLLYLVDTEREVPHSGRNVGLNAHIDVVSPYFPPSRDNEYIRGRGAIDDKGCVMVILGAMKVLDSLIAEGAAELKGCIAGMFVIDEETGGNGSLSLAMDHELQTRYYDSLLILECAGNNVYPGNRGAVFIKTEGSVEGMSESLSQDGVISELLEAYSFGLVSIVQEGLAIKHESSHPQFPQNPVYTCTGILGPFGKHPSGICDYVEFRLAGLSPQWIEPVKEAIQSGLESYIEIFGDKRNSIDSLSGKPKIDKHYSFKQDDSGMFQVEVFGSGGHMGSLPENDAAITKWAFIIRELTALKYTHEISFSIGFPERPDAASVVFEGAQSFIPGHSVKDITGRIREAFIRGTEEYGSIAPGGGQDIRWSVSFDKLHNEAFATNPESESVKNALAAAAEAGINRGNPELMGWNASCDARIFAREYPGLPVLTTGPGELNGAHSNKEALFLPDLYDSILFTVLYILRESKSKVLV